MRKLFLVKRADRVIQAPVHVTRSVGLIPAVINVGDIVFTLPELRLGRELADSYAERDGIGYVFALPMDADQCAFIIPQEDVQEIPEPDSILAIIMTLQ